MDRTGRSFESIDAAGVTVLMERWGTVASLRYFNASAMAPRVQKVLGAGLPATLAAVRVPDAEEVVDVFLAWRSPTETLLVSSGSAPIAALQAELSDTMDGCVVDQSGGIAVLRLSGERSADVLVRIGSSTSVPKQGEALTSRLAELPVLAMRVGDPEIVLLVDRVYADHLFDWIRATVEDF
jgi:heterotetrameric sarcosine oxidase gamma subunit